MTCQKSTKHIEQCKKFAQWQQLFDLTWRMISLVASSQKYLTKTKTSANANEKTFPIKSKYFIRATKNQVVCKPLNLLKMIKWLEIWYRRPKEPTESGSFFFIWSFKSDSADIKIHSTRPQKQRQFVNLICCSQYNQIGKWLSFK